MLEVSMETLRGIILVIFNVIAFAGLMSWLLYKPVRDFMKKRRDGIAAQLSEAEENLRESERLKNEYAVKLKAAEAERDQLLETARKRSLEKESQIIMQARQEAETYRERAHRDIELEKEKANEHIKTHIIEVSALMTERLLGKTLDAETSDRFFNDCMAELGDAKWQS